MREIKYQGWDIKTNEMYDAVRLDWESGELCLRARDVEYGFTAPWDDHVIVRQYTGLKDKNGVEIYEGDILRDLKHSLYEVCWKGESASFSARNIDIGSTLRHGFLLEPAHVNFAVIGNIYENPELLAGASNNA
jgi:uncharacterized phage protein (TIGR01671 family)